MCNVDNNFPIIRVTLTKPLLEVISIKFYYIHESKGSTLYTIKRCNTPYSTTSEESQCPPITSTAWGLFKLTLIAYRISVIKLHSYYLLCHAVANTNIGEWPLIEGRVY